MDNTKLKPCPFCGGEAGLAGLFDWGSQTADGTERHYFTISCGGCGASVCLGAAGKTETGVAQVWNRRADK